MKTKEKQLIENQKEYIWYLIKAISSESIISRVTFGARQKYESEIAKLESEIAKEEPEGVTAEEILNNSSVLYELEKPNNYDISYVRTLILEAMEAYAKSKQINRREELKNFNSWMCGKQYDGRIPLIGVCINEYLQSKEK